MEMMHSCLCCLRCPPDKDLTTPYIHHDETLIYLDMLKECFNIQMVLDGWGTGAICSPCAGRLRDASDFKLQVQLCQAELSARELAKSHVTEEEPVAGLPVEDEELTGYERVLYELLGPGVAAGDGASLNEESVLSTNKVVTEGDGGFGEEGMKRQKRQTKAPPVKQEPATDETDLLALEEPASSVSARARSQLAARCSVRLERLQVQAAGGGTLSGRQIYSCEQCGSFYRSKTDLRKHIQHSHSYSETVNGHGRVHTGDKPFHCNQCDYKSRWKSCLKTHMRSHTHKKPIECSYCDYKCLKKETLQSHLGIHSGLKPFQCSDCDYKCNRKNNLKQHQRIHSKTKPFQCSDCDYNCNHKASLLTHLSKHTSVKPFQCSHCDYKCNYKTSLLLHLSKHTGASLKFNSESKLKQQQGTPGVKPFRCSHCDFKCSYKGSLQRHLGLHTGLVPFQCRDCEYKCKRKDNLKQHQMIHTGVKPFQCNHCDYMCSYKASLRRHQRVHTKCSVCGFKCSDTSSLRCHEKTHAVEVFLMDPLPLNKSV